MHPGNTAWDDACKLPGARQLGLAKRFLERYPWWRIESRQDLIDPAAGDGDWRHPYCGAVDDELRVVFLPKPVDFRKTPPVLRGLNPTSSYSLLYFDPVTGEEEPRGSVRPNKNGDLTMPRPTVMYDCVIAVERDE